MSIGDRIKEARKKAGLTQVELSERIGVRHSAIHKYETGIVENIPVSKLNKIASALDVTPAYLMGWEVHDFKKNGLTMTDEEGNFITGETSKWILEENNTIQCDLLPAEFNDFSIFIGKMGYSITLENDMYFLINGDKRIKITPDDLKTLVRTSKAMIRGLLDDMMNRE